MGKILVHGKLMDEGEFLRLGELYNIDRAALYNNHVGRSFVLPRDKHWNVPFEELLELKPEDIVYHGTPKKHARSILRSKKLDIEKTMDRKIHVTIDPVSALEIHAQGDGIVIPIRVKDIPDGIRPKTCNGGFGEERYFGIYGGTGVAYKSIPISLTPELLGEVPDFVRESIARYSEN